MGTNTPTTLLSDRLYNNLRLVAQVLLPGLSALYFGLAEIWNLPYQAQVSGSIAVVGVFVGVLLSFSRALHEASGAKYDGIMTIEPGEDGDQLRLNGVDYMALDSKNELVFKLRRPVAPVGVAE